MLFKYSAVSRVREEDGCVMNQLIIYCTDEGPLTEHLLCLFM